MKPRVRERSGGQCESWPFVRDHATSEQDLYHSAPIAGTCQYRNPVHVHHRKYRSRGGTNSIENLVHLCQPCHDFVHAFPDVSNKLRLSLHEWESEEL